MLKKIKFAAGMAAVITALAIIFGVSIKYRASQTATPSPEFYSENESSELVTKVAQAQEPFGPDTNPAPENAQEIEPNTNVPFEVGPSTGIEDLEILKSLEFDDVRDVDLDYDRALLATAGGVLEFFTLDSSVAVYSYPHGLTDFNSYAVIAVNDDIIVGTTSGLYRIDSFGNATSVWKEISDTVTMVKNFEGCIYVGTRNDGLFQISENVVTQLLPGKNVIDISDDEFALWCATAEDGLLYRDDNGWHKRRLINDENAFDQVTALESAFGKLWVGTNAGLYIFNGDNWQLVDSALYLFDQNITSLAAGKSYMYIGTAQEGVFAYYDGWLSPLDWSDNLPVKSLDIYDGKYLVGLDKGGAVLNSRKGAVDILPLVRQTQGILSSLY